MTLIDQILRLAELWAAAKGHSTTARLSTIVANDGGLLKRLGEGGNTTVQSLDKFVRFFWVDANWPDSRMPSEASSLLASIGHIASLPENDALNDRVAAARKVA